MEKHVSNKELQSPDFTQARGDPSQSPKHKMGITDRRVLPHALRQLQDIDGGHRENFQGQQRLQSIPEGHYYLKHGSLLF